MPEILVISTKNDSGVDKYIATHGNAILCIEVENIVDAGDEKILSIRTTNKNLEKEHFYLLAYVIFQSLYPFIILNRWPDSFFPFIEWLLKQETKDIEASKDNDSVLIFK